MRAQMLEHKTQLERRRREQKQSRTRKSHKLRSCFRVANLRKWQEIISRQIQPTEEYVTLFLPQKTSFQKPTLQGERAKHQHRQNLAFYFVIVF